MHQASSDSWIQWAREHAAPLYGAPEVIITHGHGVWLSTIDNRELLDCASGMGVTLLGHRHPSILQAIHEQVDTLLHTSNALLSPAPLALANALARITGGMQSFFVNSGTEAIEGALKLARAYQHRRGTPRPRFVACQNGFHGRTFGALSVTGQASLQRGFAPLLPDVRFVPYGDLDALAQAVDASTAAFVIEPIQGNGGVRLPPPGYLQEAARICHAQGALMIADEIQTGIGRTGEWFCTLAQQVPCDILCTAKALGGGLPLGAVLAKREVMQALATGSHGSTFGGNPVACRAGLAVIQAIEDQNLLQRARVVERLLMPRLQALPHVAEVRARGLLFGIELCRPQQAKEIRNRALAHHLLVTLAGADTVRLFVPAIVSDQELQLVAERLGKAIEDVMGPA